MLPHFCQTVSSDKSGEEGNLNLSAWCMSVVCVLMINAITYGITV